MDPRPSAQAASIGRPRGFFAEALPLTPRVWCARVITTVSATAGRDHREVSPPAVVADTDCTKRAEPAGIITALDALR